MRNAKNKGAGAGEDKKDKKAAKALRRRSRPKKTKTQKAAIKQAVESGQNVDDINDGLFFIDTTGSKDNLPEELRPKDIDIQWDADGPQQQQQQQQRQKATPAVDPAQAAAGQGDKTVPDYVGNDEDVKDTVKVDLLPVQGSSKDLEQSATLQARPTGAKASSPAAAEADLEDGEVESSGSDMDTGDDSSDDDGSSEGSTASSDGYSSSSSSDQGGPAPKDLTINVQNKPSTASSSKGYGDEASGEAKENVNPDKSLADFVAELDEDEDDSEGVRREALRYFKEDDPLQTCHRCGESGHSVRNCEHVQCLTCGKLDEHTTRECPLTMTCHRCASRGHHIRDCPVDPMQARRSLNQQCERCSSRLHTSSNCPYIWRVYIRSPNAPANPPRMRFACYNCASGDHFGDDCKFPRAHPIKYVDRSAFTFDGESNKRQRVNPTVNLDERTNLPRPEIVNGRRNDSRGAEKGKDAQRSRPSLQRQIEMSEEEEEDEEEAAFAKRLKGNNNNASAKGGKGGSGAAKGSNKNKPGNSKPIFKNLGKVALDRERRDSPNNHHRFEDGSKDDRHPPSMPSVLADRLERGGRNGSRQESPAPYPDSFHRGNGGGTPSLLDRIDRAREERDRESGRNSTAGQRDGRGKDRGQPYTGGRFAKARKNNHDRNANDSSDSYRPSPSAGSRQDGGRGPHGGGGRYRGSYF